MHVFRYGIVLLLLAGPHFSIGQDAGFQSFIARLSDQYKVDVAIAPELIPTLDSIRNVGTEITSVQELLYRLLNHSGITYQLIDGNKLMLRRESLLDQNHTLAVLVGTVTDNSNGEPVSYATVMADKSNAACNTDDHGRFVLPIRDTSGFVTVSFLGYSAVKIPVRNALKGSMEIRLEVHKIPLEEVIVIVPYRLFTQDYTAQSTDLTGYQFISESQLLHWNAERLLTSLTSYTHFSSDRGIKIRGSEAGNSLVMMDHIPVYDPYHFYNIFSPFNGHYFSSVEVYKNNLPIEYGGRIDGLIHVQSDREAPDTKLILDTDLLQSGLTTEVAITPNMYVTAGGRISHTAILNEALRDSVNNFRIPGRFKNNNEWSTSQQPTSEFYDINLGLSANVGKSNQVSLHFFDSRDQLDNTIRSDFETSFLHYEGVSVHQNYVSTDVWKNRGFSAGLQSTLSEQTRFHLTAFHSLYDKQVNYTSNLEEQRPGSSRNITNTGYQESNLKSLGLKGHIQHNMQEHGGFTTGMDLQKHEVQFTAIENNKAFLGQTQQETEASLFGEYGNTLWKKVDWFAGSRFTYLESTGKVYALPNIRLHYTIDALFSLRASFSKNLQTVRALTLEDRFGRELDYLILSEPMQGYPVLKSDKYMVGAGYSTTSLSLDVELYYKKVDGVARVRPLQPDPSAGEPESLDDFYRLFTGEGRTYGMDVTVLYKIKKAEVSILYTLSKIEERYAMLFGGEYFAPQDDRRHQVKAAGSYTFGKFRASTLITYKSKAPYLSLVRLDGGEGIGMADYKAVQRYLPAYFSLDLGLEYTFALFKQPAMVGVSLINASNHQNVSDLQHLGKVSRAGGSQLFITSQTELLGRTANVHFRYLIN